METPKHIYMVGIGGIGLSALAQYFAAQGSAVSGSDREASPTTAMLSKKGITVFIGQKAEQVPADANLLVYSDAVPPENFERVRARELGIRELSYFEALGLVSSAKRTVAVSGTNGKTTTTAMLGKMLADAGADPTMIVGSIASDFGSNFRAGAGDLFIVEACEYRDHFLTFKPEVLVITNIEFDHTDFFSSLDDVIQSFREAARGVRAGGVIVANPHDPAVARAIEGAEARVVDYTVEQVPKLLMPGSFNEANARAAKAAARAVAPHLSGEALDTALATFHGTWRRFEYKGVGPSGARIYDDYAHHPTAIKSTIEAAREQFPDKKIAVAFHPHLYSRTRDLFDGFAAALATADLAYILPVYAARETPDPTFDHAALARAASARGGHAHAISGIDEAAQKLAELGPEFVAFTMGAGDVYKAGEQVLLRGTDARTS